MANISSYLSTLRGTNDGKTIRNAIADITEAVNTDNNSVITLLGGLNPTAIAAAAVTATTKAGEAAGSADNAMDSQVVATAQADIATTKAAEALASKNAAGTSETNSKASETAAAASAATATTKAGESAASAAAALASEQAAAEHEATALGYKDATLAAVGGATDLAEIIESRKGKVTLGEKISEIDSQLAEKAKISDVNTQIASVASGSPKGVYATLALLQAAYPTGNSNIYVVSADGKWYYWSGTAWGSGGVYQTTGIGDASITNKMLSKTYSYGQTGANLFDVDSITTGRYLYSTIGTTDVAAGYNVTDYIPVMPGKIYRLISAGQSCFYDANKVYISGLASISSSFTTPANCYFVRLTVTNPQLSGYYVYANDDYLISQTYEPYMKVPSGYKLQSIEKKHIKDYYQLATKPKNIITVAKSGGDYNTIMGAVNAYINDVNNPLTILLAPGIYLESIDLRGKYISVVGMNKNTCIVRNDDGDYWKPPFNLSAQNHLYNLTVISTADVPTGASPGLVPYAIHADGSTLEGLTSINNCIARCTVNVAIGMGLANNHTILIDRCEVDSDVNGLTCHNKQANGAINQRLIVRNSVIKSGNENAFFAQDANHREGGGYGDARDTVYSFYNNIFWSEINGKTNAVGGDASLETGKRWGYIKISDDSFGNNIAELNK